MTWPHWVLAGLFVVNTLITVGMIGKERDDITPASAIAAILVNAGLAFLLVWGNR